MNLDDVKKFMSEVGWCDMATTDGREVGVRPMAGYIWMDKEIWFATSKSSAKVRHLIKVTHTELCFSKPGGEHVRLSGFCQISTEGFDKQRLYNAVPALKDHIKDPQDPDYVVLRVRPNRIRMMNAQMQNEEISV